MVNQKKYALELLTNACVLACKTALIPIDNHEKLSTGSVIQAYKKLKID